MRRAGVVVLILLSGSFISQAQCPLKNDTVNSSLPSPAIDALSAGDQTIQGKVLDSSGAPVTDGTVTVCIAGNLIGTPQSLGSGGSFSVSVGSKLTQGQSITAQYQPKSGNPSNISVPVTVGPPKATCTNANKPGTQPIWLFIQDDGSFNGDVPGEKSGAVTICLNGMPFTDTKGNVVNVGINADGSFSGKGLTFNKVSDTYMAEYAPPQSPGGSSPSYSNSSPAIPIKLLPSQTTNFLPVAPLGVAIAALDIAGASSTDPQAVFLGAGVMDVPVMGRSLHNPNGTTNYSYNNILWLSGSLRIAGMAQPGTLSASSISSFGTYLSSAVNANPDKIVQSFEANATLAWQLTSWKGDVSSFDSGTFIPTSHHPNPTTLFTVSAIASIGAITPLSASQANPQVYYLTSQIENNFGITTPSTCSIGSSPPTCYVAFVPYDRTHFYRNYEAGFRLKVYGGDYSANPIEYRFPAIADVAIGQNEYVTGGRLHGSVLHLGGTMPVPKVSSFYVFGAMDLGMNFSQEKQDQQLLLTPVPATASVTYLSPSVTTVPVSQPNRDRYQFGFGIDVFSLISTLKTKTATSTAAAPTAPTQ